MSLFIASRVRQFVHKGKEQYIIGVHATLGIAQTHVYMSLVTSVGGLIFRRVHVLVKVSRIEGSYAPYEAHNHFLLSDSKRLALTLQSILMSYNVRLVVMVEEVQQYGSYLICEGRSKHEELILATVDEALRYAIGATSLNRRERIGKVFLLTLHCTQYKYKYK